MNNADSLDEVAEPITLAANTLASPLAEVQAMPVADAASQQASPAVAATVPVAAVVMAPAPAAPVAVSTPTAASSTASPLGTLTPSTPATWPMLGALLLVVGLILVLGKLVRHLQNRQVGKGAALSIKGGVQVGGKERVVWMQAGDTHLLLGVSPGHVQTLHVFEVPPDFSAPTAKEAATTTPATRDFSERLKTLLEHARAKGIDTQVATAAAPLAPVPLAAAPSKPPDAARAATSKPTFSFRA